jgi:hypothetical protein
LKPGRVIETLGKNLLNSWRFKRLRGWGRVSYFSSIPLQANNKNLVNQLPHWIMALLQIPSILKK